MHGLDMRELYATFVSLAKAKRSEAEMRAAGLVQVPRPEKRNGKTVMVKRWVRPEDVGPARAPAEGAAKKKTAPTAQDFIAHNPFDLYAQGEHHLRAYLHGLSTKDKRRYLKAYNLAPEDDRREADDAQLVEMGVSAARSKHDRMVHGRASDHPPSPEERAPPPPSLLDRHAADLDRMEREARREGHHAHADRLAGVRGALAAAKPLTDNEAKTRIFDAIKALDHQGALGAPVVLANLRRRLRDIPREELDRHLLRLARAWEINLSEADRKQRPNAMDADDMLEDDNGRLFNVISIRRS